jgi:iron complex transport system ATP-binding protein
MTLDARGLAFGYPSRTVGEGLDLTLAHGESACVLGPNGSGKSTLIKTLLGLLPPLAGGVYLEGRDLAGWPVRERAARLAYVPQAAESYFDFSVLEMVEMGRTAHRGVFARPGARDRAVARDALERLGLGALADRPIHAVSGGERQLTLVARALATEARLLVLDEPTANLDFGNQFRVLAEIERLRDSGIGFLLSTHDPDHALRLGGKALLLRAGKALAQGDAAEILVAQNLSKLYGVTVHVMEVETPDGPRRVCVPALAA